MGEPFAAFARDADSPGLPGVLIAQAMRAEEREARQEAKAEAARAAEREDRREAHLHYFLQDQLFRAQMDPARRDGVDPMNPATFVLTPEQISEQIARTEDAEVARVETRRAIADGRLHVLNVPASEMSAPPPSAEEQETQRADLQLQSARHRTEHATIVAKIRRALKKGASS